MAVNPDEIKERVRAIVSSANNVVPPDAANESPPPEKTPKKTRRTKVERVVEDEQVKNAKLQEQAVSMTPVIYGLAAPLINRWTPHKPYTQEEAFMLSSAMAAVSAKYPGVFKYSEEFTLCIIALAQFGGRYMESERTNATEQGASNGNPDVESHG